MTDMLAGLVPSPFQSRTAPIITSYPDQQTAFGRKWGESDFGVDQVGFNPLTQFDARTLGAIARTDAERVRRGQRPLSARETTLAGLAGRDVKSTRLPYLPLSTISGSTSPTPEPERSTGLLSIPSNFLADIGGILKSLPRVPAGIAREANQLGRLPGELRRVSEGADNPLETLGNVANLPGVRMLPGTYTLGQFGREGGGASELARHPGYTFLDVLPIASKLTAGTKGFKAGRSVMQSEHAAEVARRTSLGLPETAMPRFREPRPIPTALTRGRTGELNPLGETIQRGLASAASYVPERLRTTAQELGIGGRAFGESTARAESRMRAMADDKVKSQWLGDTSRFPEDELTSISGRIMSIRDRHSAIPLARQIELDDLVQGGGGRVSTTGEVAKLDLSDAERSYAFELRDLGDDLARYSESEGELFRAQMNRVDPATGTPLDEGYEPEWLSAGQNSRLTRAQSRLNTVEGQYTSRTSLESQLDHLLGRSELTLPSGEPVTRLSMGNMATAVDLDTIPRLLEALQPYTRRPQSRPNVVRFQQAYNKGDFTAARAELAKMSGRGWLDDETAALLPSASDILSEARRVTRDLSKLPTEKYLQTTRRRFNKTLTNIGSARWKPAAEDVVNARVQDILKERHYDNPEALNTWLTLAEQRNYAALGDALPRADFDRVRREAFRSWVDLREAGLDPTFVHRVRPDAALQTARGPKVLNRVVTPSQIRERTWDTSSYIPDAQVALSHQAAELLSRRITQEHFEMIAKTWGKSYADKAQEMLPHSQRTGRPVDDLIREESVRLDPKQFFTFGKRPRANIPGKADVGADIDWSDVWVPKVIQRNFERLVRPESRITAALDPVMNVFRTSVLALSPRWHLYNVLGNSTMMMARTDPTVFRFWNQAREMVGSPLRKTPGRGLPEGLPAGGMGQVPAEMMEWGKKSTPIERAIAAHQYAGASTARRMWDDFQQTKPKQGFDRVVQGSYELNAWFDDMTRAMTYLYGKSKAERGGLTRAAAEREGIGLVRKTMQNWDEVTVLERTILRNVFPFYGWISHVMRYVSSYPFDHPIRTSVTAAFGRNEIDDMGTGLPQRFAALFGLGDMDEQGNLLTLNLSGANPFGDTANYFSKEGLTRNLNPLLTGILRSLGVDPLKGGPELYPDLEYDTETGSFRAKTPNPVQAFMEGLVPQTRLAASALFDNDQFRSMIRDDPEAASRLLQQSLGAPGLFREYNIPEETFRTELTRAEAQDNARREALKTGNLDALDRWPGLKEYAARIKALEEAGALEQYKPAAEEGGGYGQLVRGAGTLQLGR